MTWLDLYEQARTRHDAAAGYYNDNIRIESEDGTPVIVRIPIHGADIVDLRSWPEQEVLTAIAPWVRHAPRVLHASADPLFQVHEFIAGQLLNDIAPRGVPVPLHVLDDVVQLFVQLTQVPREKLPSTPEGWPADGDTPGFARQLSNVTQQAFDTFCDDYADLYTAFAFPAQPLSSIDLLWSTLTRRPFVCVHADVHRRNMIVSNGVSTFLDWELAVWGDPVYELAVHLHKMDYRPDERAALLTRWASSMPREHTANWQQDLESYLTHERIKSALVDTARYAQLFAQGGPYPYPEHQLISTLTAKINAARTAWGIPERINPDLVEDAIRSRM